MKKFAIAIAGLTLIVIIGLLIKRNDTSETQPPFFHEEQPIPEAKAALKNAQKALDKVSPDVAPKVAQTPAAQPEEGMVMSDEQMAKLEDYFEKVEKDWSNRMNDLFNKELGLDPKVLNEYYKMREGYEQDKLDAFEEFHDEMIEKYGENYTYKPSEEEQLFSAKVRERYDQALVKLIGDKAYARYIEERDQFNRELSEVDDKELGFIKVDF